MYNKLKIIVFNVGNSVQSNNLLKDTDVYLRVKFKILKWTLHTVTDISLCI